MIGTYSGTSRSSTIQHIVQCLPPYRGMRSTALCGAKVSVLDKHVGTAPHAVQPVGTCKRCAKVLDQTVREA